MVAMLPGITPQYIMMMHAEQEQLNTKIEALTQVVGTDKFDMTDGTLRAIILTKLFAMQAHSAAIRAHINFVSPNPANN